MRRPPPPGRSGRDRSPDPRTRRPFEELGRGFSVGMGAPGSESPSPPFAGKGPKGYRRSDARIHEDVCERLSTGYIDASEIEVEVADGTVTLRGSVPDKRSRRDAEDLIEYVAGIREVHNQLRVASAYDRAGERDGDRDEDGPHARHLS